MTTTSPKATGPRAERIRAQNRAFFYDEPTIRARTHTRNRLLLDTAINFALLGIGAAVAIIAPDSAGKYASGIIAASGGWGIHAVVTFNRTMRDLS